MVISAKHAGIKQLIVPSSNVAEAQLVRGVTVFGLNDIKQVVQFLEGKSIITPGVTENPLMDPISEDSVDFWDVKGQNLLIESIVMAAAGGHNMLMIGEPGCGKSMIAKRIPTILPKMTEEEALEVTKLYSISGLLKSDHSLILQRPFRAPHHNASLNALIGGGNLATPGEVSRGGEVPLRTMECFFLMSSQSLAGGH
jgi:magnesium chelatase family protein